MLKLIELRRKVKESSGFLLPKFRLTRKKFLEELVLWIVTLRPLVLMAIDIFLLQAAIAFLCLVLASFMSVVCSFLGPESAHSHGQFLTIMHTSKRPALEQHIVVSLNV